MKILKTYHPHGYDPEEGGKTSMIILGIKAIILRQHNSSLRFQDTKLNSNLHFFKLEQHKFFF